jgi:hypothetical protein
MYVGSKRASAGCFVALGFMYSIVANMLTSCHTPAVGLSSCTGLCTHQSKRLAVVSPAPASAPSFGVAVCARGTELCRMTETVFRTLLLPVWASAHSMYDWPSWCEGRHMIPAAAQWVGLSQPVCRHPNGWPDLDSIAFGSSKERLQGRGSAEHCQ